MVQSEVAGEFGDVVAEVWREKRDPGACPSGATSATDPVHVGIAVGGRVEVDHMRDPVHVNSSRCDVGRHESIDLTGGKP